MKKKIKAIDFFCSGGGMTCGLRQAGIDVIAGIDNDPACKDTYERNNPESKFILADVFKLKEQDLEKQLGLKKNDNNLVMIGCSPCQFWSIIRTDKTKSAKSKNLLVEFKRFVDYFNPGYVLVENVPGILGKKDKSGLDNFVTSLKIKGYSVHYEIVNMNDYGIPQSRKRFSLIATRLSKNKISLQNKKSKKALVKDFIGSSNGFARIKAGHKDDSIFNHSVAGLTQKNIDRLKKTQKNGGSWLDWAQNKDLKRKSYRGQGFKDNYGRMSWNKPAPTITTKFFSISNGRFAHPQENRAISLREGATLQTFPKNYVFHAKSIADIARMIGNAVPPIFAKQLGKVILNSR
ncbi:DNA (cytosine-5-)-methyltransferase [Candidatus Nomurabacteria bacterium RIFCSPHIGHO2_01_FULL_42_15]|uniref:DNA (cytosine-5-)-methyltransferase n=1 Tax=Candidatus Nomurabacteria bacterium RIFCSPHIGHO2_01_FULL_42_15 TaxID=1801742 RepID=A0A1F6VGI0_9BACT|nr:MAG: DNA (cytosine-5-)-methyltransferase [Candidatus Nomurabacteria bacterium RIFCSPHIGHO2_01_FULL_42_15]OGI92881.1 MAG: DNA (cytosine-5-)-methyltransferase [Candidatus Nomurabacteria bacterium RIFCSPLOWO2_01_FULL_41_18]